MITGAESLIFLLLALYLEQVVPKETGIAKHPLFCLKKSKKKGKKRRRTTKYLDGTMKNSDSFLIDGVDSKAELFEQVDEPQLAMSMDDNTLEIKELNKIYGNKKHAVRGLNLTMYSD
jgi:hypothetical protein